MQILISDLTSHSPRSPRTRLGGYVILPRILDKGRALIADTNGEYNYACPLDQNFFEFSQISPDDLKAQLATGQSDTEILNWVREQVAGRISESDIARWSAHTELQTPMSIDKRGFFHQIHEEVAPERDDIATWFDLLDLDDYASFGGKP